MFLHEKRLILFIVRVCKFREEKKVTKFTANAAFAALTFYGVYDIHFVQLEKGTEYKQYYDFVPKMTPYHAAYISSDTYSY